MQVGAEPLCLYFQEVRPLPLPVRTPFFSLQAAVVGGRRLTQEIMLCLPPLGVPVAEQQLWQRGAAVEALMGVQEAQTVRQDTQTLVMTTEGRLEAGVTLAMEVASMMVELVPAHMAQEVDLRLLEVLLGWEEPVLLLASLDTVASAAAVQGTMLEEGVGGTVVGIRAHQAIDAEGVEAARTTSMAPCMQPHSTACGIPPCTGLFLPISLLDSA